MNTTQTDLDGIKSYLDPTSPAFVNEPIRVDRLWRLMDDIHDAEEKKKKKTTTTKKKSHGMKSKTSWLSDQLKKVLDNLVEAKKDLARLHQVQELPRFDRRIWVHAYGHAGMGKTELARRAFQDAKGKFDRRIWVHAYGKNTESDLLKEIWKSVAGHKPVGEMNVLDVVWNHESATHEAERKQASLALDSFKRCAQDGSRIVMTTRAKDLIILDGIEPKEVTDLINHTQANLFTYRHLPPHLQHCLEFCSIFPYNWSFGLEKLTKMWIAHGFVEKAQGYFQSLVDRSFFREEGGTYVIHEQIHWMIRMASANNCISISATVRHLSVTSGCLDKLKEYSIYRSGTQQSADLASPKGCEDWQAETCEVYLGLPSTISSDLGDQVNKLMFLQTLSVGRGDKGKDRNRRRARRKPSRLDLESNGPPNTQQPTAADPTVAVIEGLKPHSYLDDLRITRYPGETSPTWLGGLKKLTRLCLKNCRKLKALPALGELPCLELLDVKELPCVERIDGGFCGAGVFPELKKLVLDDMPRLVAWDDMPKLAFPRLTEVSIVDCPRLSSLSGLDCCTGLLNRRVKGCPAITPETLPAAFSASK
ncbi:hypothetical protein VPH35_018159 [Triticum aestivum]